MLDSQHWFLFYLGIRHKVGTRLRSLNKLPLILSCILELGLWQLLLILPLWDLPGRKRIFIRTERLRNRQEGQLLRLVMPWRVLATQPQDGGRGFFAGGIDRGEEVDGETLFHDVVEGTVFIVYGVGPATHSRLRLFNEGDFVVK